ncbi:unnamed protein product [Rotaria sordida]|uniref:Uncharacterized protein n=1 Tax=Rotaria sordida TaxID=392033 RepID=A0A815DWJ8_9BILA|nr:unnamed protein product [Rotaria sordida]CAF1348507.1 unnamed protein product [Rotaria sordida]CAF1482860.1 unnamed protein product [Rotaria sordida]CAF3731691.1 unnamed protein product [Rotaria sordida]CAF3995497.1 unnamed protein product [Rotaria sordida]
MSAVSNPKSAKILILDIPDLPTQVLGNLVVHCSTIEQLLATSNQYNDFILIIACTSAKFAELIPVLRKILIDELYVLNIGDTIKGAVEPWWNKTTIVYNVKQLMRHLCTKIMLCYFNEGIAHRKNGDSSLANACMVDSLHALDCSAQFI